MSISTTYNSYQRFSTHRNYLGMYIFPFLTEKESRTLKCVNKAWEGLGKNCAYHALVKGKRLRFFYIKSEKDSLEKIKLGKFLGSGGSKMAYEIEGGKAILLPNTVDNLNDVVIRWKRMVDEEVGMTEILTKTSLLSPQPKKVMISFSPETPQIPVMISQSFENLGKTHGLFIIDTKNLQSCTWKWKKDFFFKSQEERLDEKNWDSVMSPLLMDIATSYVYDIPIFRDTINFAVQKIDSTSAVSSYQIRFFGFDFTSKHRILELPVGQITKSPDRDEVESFLISLIEEIFCWEFSGKQIRVRDFSNMLAKKYSHIVTGKIEEMLKQSLDVKLIEVLEKKEK